MKKIITLLAFVALSFSAFAQNNSQGDFGTEIYFRPWNGNATFSLIDGVKARYFISDKLAVRATLNFDRASETDYSYVTIANKEIETKQVDTYTQFGITPGIEYHFASYEKISLYAGAQVGLSFANAKSKTTNNDNSDMMEITGTSGLGSGGFSFGISAFTGIDYHFTNNLYIGAELGFGYNSFKSKEVKTKAVVGNTTIENTNKDYTSTSDLDFYCTPAVRIGWTF